MIKLFNKNFIGNLIRTALVIIICCTVVGIHYLLETHFGAAGLVVGLSALILIWVILLTYEETKREMKKEE